MDVNNYQNMARQTAIYPPENKVIYPVVGMANEAGEALGRVKKHLRGDFNLNDPYQHDNLVQREKLIDEIGDVLWYAANALSDLDVTMTYAMRKNLDKVQRRKREGQLRGDGDDR